MRVSQEGRLFFAWGFMGQSEENISKHSLKLDIEY